MKWFLLLVLCGIFLVYVQNLTVRDCARWLARTVVRRPPACRFGRQFISLYVDRAHGGGIPVRMEYAEDRGRRLLVYVHGPQSDVLTSNPLARVLAETLGYDVLTYDEPGAGVHEGPWSEDEAARCLQDVLEYGARRYEARSTVVWGVSLGACTVASVLGRVDTDVQAVVLQSPYYSADSFYIGLLPAWLHQFTEEPSRSAMNHVAAMRCPVLVVQEHGSHARGVEVQDVFGAVASARRQLVEVESVEGSDEWSPDLLLRVRRFLDP